MRIANRRLQIASLALWAGPLLTGLAYAEHGHHGGGGGGGHHGGGGAHFSGGGGGGGHHSGPSISSHSGGHHSGPSSTFSRSGNNGPQHASREFSGHPQGSPGRQQHSFYRGPNTDRSNVSREDRNRNAERFGNDRNRGDHNQQFSRDHNPNFGGDRFDRRTDEGLAVDRIRHDWRDWDHGNALFRYGWWDTYGGNWPVYSPWRYSRWRDRPYYWWSWTPARALTSWLVFNWARPYYWDYGPGRNIYYRDDYVYYDDRQVMPVDDYYQYVYDIAHDVPSISEAEAAQMDWRPLGVFALTREEEPDSHRVLQLAVNRDGVLSGTYFNHDNGQVHPLLGSVDDRTQRAAWAFADGEHKPIVFETSIYNLSKTETSMMVHFGPQAGDTEVWHLVRLEQPDEYDNGSPAATGYSLP
jgi:hypothetical protein